MDYPNKEGDVSTYNEASLKMMRLNNIQININKCNLNLFEIDLETERFKYEIKISLINSLFSEISSKCSDGETDKNQVWNNAIQKILKNAPPFKTRFNEVRHKSEFLGWNTYNCDLIKDTLFKYENFVRKLLEVHGYGSPKQKDPKKSIED